jgi:hypothetical protein
MALLLPWQVPGGGHGDWRRILPRNLPPASLDTPCEPRIIQLANIIGLAPWGRPAQHKRMVPETRAEACWSVYRADVEIGTSAFASCPLTAPGAGDSMAPAQAKAP